MKRVLFMSLFFVCSVILTACGPPITEEQMNELKNADIIDDNQPFLEKVGQKKEIEFVKHIEGNEYELGIIDNKGSIGWITVYKGGQMELRKDNYEWNFLLDIRYDNSIKKSYIERVQNEIAEFDDPLESNLESYQYIVYVAKDNLEGGVTERSCGKNCTEALSTEIISN